MFNREYWDKLYSPDVFLFGESPNLFLKDKLVEIPAGKILFAAEGEGRNAVFAAQNGWSVSAFDLSVVAKHKADTLAQKAGLEIDYHVGDIAQLDYESESFDVLALIFAHFEPEKRSTLHKQLSSYLKRGGWLILQGFGNGKSLGEDAHTSTHELYYDLEMLKKDFADFEMIEISEKIIQMNEGRVLQGQSVIVSMLARKK